MVVMSEQSICTLLEIGKIISRRRQEMGFTQEALAERIDVTSQQVQRYEYGKNKLNVENLQRIARVLDVPVAYFFCDQESKGEHLDQTEKTFIEMLRGIENGQVKEMVVKMLKAAIGEGERV
jgi:transcriptional regulator with XRE-family HTH domain